jgi:pimeloyl-ACP methyl ester carboxylesterase
MPDPFAGRRLRISAPDGDFALLRFGAAGAPPLLFAHANGFCASAYRQMLEALGDRFDVFAVDQRGHGGTTLPARPGGRRSLDQFGADLGMLIEALASQIAPGARWRLAGHSLGAVASALAAIGRTDIEALCLVEPVAMPRSLSLLAQTPVWPALSRRMPLVAGALNRRASWPDRAATAASYRRKALFANWAEGALEDYLADGLIGEAGGVRLACAPAWEAANFAAQGHDFWGAVRAAPCAVHVLAVLHASTTTPAFARRRFAAMGAKVTAIDGATHLVPFENPSLVADFLKGAA